ncbi:MAG: NADH-quinone oxidoreductase subunit N, partial [Syntrophales bacterium]|nr:NADH-quinone oxidoreductase subunit N [Syntrophales bacterium]
MNAYNLAPIFPFIIVASTLTLGMVILALGRNHGHICRLAKVGIACAFFIMPLSFSRHLMYRKVTPLFMLDNYALFYMELILAAVFAIILLSYDYLEDSVEKPEEYYLLLLLATLGAMALAASSHFASLFLGLETLSIALYALIAYPRTGNGYLEAGVKYLILSSFSAAFLVFGMALIYAQLGTMEFSRIAVLMSSLAFDPVLSTGTAMVIIGIGFKLAVVPFHMWTPDVYEGAPVPVTAFIATVSKGAIFALLLRYFAGVEIAEGSPLFIIFSIIAIASMFTGNLLALLQNNVKRLLAYSSIAHFGYLLVAFLSVGPFKVTAVTYYLVAYIITMLGAFGVMTVMSGKGRDADALADYEGLFSRRPWIAVTLTLMPLSLAGIPLTAGFSGKFLVMTAGIGAGLK